MPALQQHEDLARYRDTGELSDLTVRLGSVEWKLHKFPLFIKSDYFKEALEKQQQEQQSSSLVVELEPSFPGGEAAFGLVADFCYNKRIDLSPANVVQLLCAAGHLRMTGGGRPSLTELAHRYLGDLLSAARVARSAGPILALLDHCTAVGAAADEAKVSQSCLAALLDVWYRSSNSSGVTEQQLLSLSLDRFLQLVAGATAAAGTTGDENTRQWRLRPLARLAAAYLDRAIRRELEPPTSKQQQQQQQQSSVSPPVRDPGREETEEASEKKKQKEKEDEEKEVEEKEVEEKKEPPPQQPAEPQQPAAEVLDRVILSLPDDAPLAEAIDSGWMRRALQVSRSAAASSAECRAKLLLLAGSVLHRFSPDELRDMPGAVLREIVDTSVKAEGAPDPELLACLVDSHLLELSTSKTDGSGGLTTEEFVKLAESVPSEYRASHDVLFEVAEILLDVDPPVSEEERQKILAVVDLSRCNEATLQRALDKGLVPPQLVCQAAIDVAKKLRLQVEENNKERRTTQTKYTYRGAASRSNSGTYYSTRTPIGHQQLYGSSSRRLDPTAGSSAGARFHDDLHLPTSSGSGGLGHRSDGGGAYFQQQQQQQHSRHQHYNHYLLDDYDMPTAGAAASINATYGLPYSGSSRPHEDDSGPQSLAIFEENLRAELGKISASYDHYLADRGVKSEYRLSYRGSPGKRW